MKTRPTKQCWLGHVSSNCVIPPPLFYSPQCVSVCHGLTPVLSPSPVTSPLPLAMSFPYPCDLSLCLCPLLPLWPLSSTCLFSLPHWPLLINLQTPARDGSPRRRSKLNGSKHHCLLLRVFNTESTNKHRTRVKEAQWANQGWFHIDSILAVSMVDIGLNIWLII